MQGSHPVLEELRQRRGAAQAERAHQGPQAQGPGVGDGVVVETVRQLHAHLGVDELRSHLSEKLAKYKIPREVIIAKGLPRNPSGKIMKHKIRAEVNA